MAQTYTLNEILNAITSAGLPRKAVDKDDNYIYVMLKYTQISIEEIMYLKKYGLEAIESKTNIILVFKR